MKTIALINNKGGVGKSKDSRFQKTIAFVIGVAKYLLYCSAAFFYLLMPRFCLGQESVQSGSQSKYPITHLTTDAELNRMANKIACTPISYKPKDTWLVVLGQSARGKDGKQQQLEAQKRLTEMNCLVSANTLSGISCEMQHAKNQSSSLLSAESRLSDMDTKRILTILSQRRDGLKEKAWRMSGGQIEPELSVRRQCEVNGERMMPNLSGLCIEKNPGFVGGATIVQIGPIGVDGKVDIEEMKKASRIDRRTGMTSGIIKEFEREKAKNVNTHPSDAWIDDFSRRYGVPVSGGSEVNGFGSGGATFP